jgi:L-ascorbate metabolism protein UlaG (beta-lactamase superfamily)
MHGTDIDPARLVVRTIGGPTAVLEFAGLRLMTDPTFDPPGSYEPRPGVKLTKMDRPALSPEEIGTVEAVLLSHNHHVDNLDISGREYLRSVPRVLTTVGGAGRLGGVATPLGNWAHVDLDRPAGGTLRITGVPAQHGPDGSEHLVGEVTGFVLSGEDLPTVYISGDNASLEVVREISGRVGKVDIAVLFAGGAQMPYLGDAYLTLSGTLAADATRTLDARAVVPLHFEGWAHYSESAEDLERAFAVAGLSERLVLAEAGETVGV